MLNVISTITFVQQPQTGFANRGNTLVFNFAHEFEVTSTWRDLTDKGKITLPKNVYVRDENNKLVSLAGPNVNMGGFLPPATGGISAGGTGILGSPVFMRGDKVKILLGYSYFDNRGNQVSPVHCVFEGYISKVSSHKPVELELMDNMYILQRKQAMVKEWVNYTVGDMMQEMIDNASLPFTVSDTGPAGSGGGTNIGTFRTGNETIAQVLARLRKDYNFEAYFKGGVLHCGEHFYNAALLTKTPLPAFAFEQNIIKDDLNYSRVDDITISEFASTTSEQETGETTKDGQAKTTKQHLQVLVTFKSGDLTPTYFTPSPGSPIPDNKEGERKTAFFPQAKTIADLEALAVNDLQKFYYQGFKGKFTTFGQPFIQHGDLVAIVDHVLPERNGNYWVRSVKYTCGTDGLRQEIELDYKAS